MSKVKKRQASGHSLNLGCGNDYRDDWVNLDVEPSVTADVHHDLDEYPWPFDDGQFLRIEARHVFEHVEEPLRAFRECARILDSHGRLTWVYPIGHTRFEDATHKHFWNYNTPEQLLGDRKHSHETGLPFIVVDKNVNWGISGGSGLFDIYTRIREGVFGPGPWLSQIPGLYGEVEVVFEYDG